MAILMLFHEAVGTNHQLDRTSRSNLFQCQGAILTIVLALCGLGDGVSSPAGAQTLSPTQTRTGPTLGSIVRCQAEGGPVICRLTDAEFVWCKTGVQLGQLEGAIGRDQNRLEALIADARAGGTCGTTRGIIMNALNQPERTLEGVLHPEVSKTTYAPRPPPVVAGSRPVPAAARPEGPVQTWNRERGWCRAGDWCETLRPAVFCSDRSAFNRVLTEPVGPLRLRRIEQEGSCRSFDAGAVLKPAGAGDGRDRAIFATHGFHGDGVITADAFGRVSEEVPLTVTNRLDSIEIHYVRAPTQRAMGLSGQGTERAVGTFQSLPADIVNDCRREPGEENRQQFQTCLARQQRDAQRPLMARANCQTKTVRIFDSLFQLRPSSDEPGSVRPYRREMVWHDVEKGEWLDGSSASGEVAIDTAFDALCPGIRQDARQGLVFRDPAAQFPGYLRGIWASSPEACRDIEANPRTHEQTYLEIKARVLSGYEYRGEINVIRPVGRNTIQVDMLDLGQGGNNFSTEVLSVGADGRLSNGRTGYVRCFGSVRAVADETPSVQTRQTPVPQFVSFQVPNQHRGRNAPLVLTQQQRNYRTRLLDASRQTPNFAGRYVLTTWGCGTSCLSGAIYDAATGRVTDFPFTICCAEPASLSFNSVEFRRDSRLVIFAGLRNEREGDMGAHFYEFTGTEFRFLRTVPNDGRFAGATR